MSRCARCGARRLISLMSVTFSRICLVPPPYSRKLCCSPIPSAIDNRQRQAVPVVEHYHDRLRHLFVDKARDVDELCARVGIAGQLERGEEVGLHQCIVDGVRLKQRLLRVHFFIGDLEEEVKRLPVVTAQFLGGALALRGGC